MRLNTSFMLLPLLLSLGCSSPQSDAKITCKCIEKALAKDGQAYKDAMKVCIDESKEIDKKYTGDDSETLKSTRRECGKPLFKRAAEKDRAMSQ